MSNYHLRRCTICNQTNVASLAYSGEYSEYLRLMTDPTDRSKVICSDCSDYVYEAVRDFGYDEEDDE